MVIALDHGGHGPQAAASGGIKRPNFFAHRVVVGVDDVGGVTAVAGQVNLLHAVARQCIEVMLWVKTMVDR